MNSPASSATQGTDQAELYALALEIRTALAARLERLQAVVDGALLAVEQVQDRRIDLLESSPEVTIDEVVFDLLLGLAMGKVGAALKTITDSIAKQLADSAVAYGRLASNKKFASVMGGAIKYADKAKFDEIFKTSRLGPSVTITPAHVKRYNVAVREFLAARIGQSLDKASERSLAVVEKGLPSTTHRVDLESTDSPSVAMLAAAQSFVSAQRYAQEVFHATFEMLVLGGTLSRAELDDIRAAVELVPLEATYEEIRDRHKMLYEAALWCRLFKFSGGAGTKSSFFLSSSSSRLNLGNAPAPLVRYWKHRFERTIQKTTLNNWNALMGSEADKGKLFNTPYWDLGQMDQDHVLCMFFEAVSADFTSALQDTHTDFADCGFSTTTPLVPKN